MMVIDISVLSFIVIGLTEALKVGFGIPKRLVPLIGIALAILIGGVAAFFGMTDLTILEAVVAGLMAMGLWSGTKNTLKK